MSARRGPAPGRRQRRLGQNFLSDPNLLELIVREARVLEGDVVLEIGGGAGSLTARLAPIAEALHVIEMDTSLRERLESAAAAGNVNLVWGDAMGVALVDLEPPPTRVVANLPYAIATPVLLRTIDELPSVGEWLVMVQREIADRLRAAPGGKQYGGPSVQVQHACDVELVRAVGREVFSPPPRVDSALLRLVRRGPSAPAGMVRLVRAGFAHRRKALAGAVAMSGLAGRDAVRAALADLELREDARAEMLSAPQFAALAEKLGLDG